MLAGYSMGKYKSRSPLHMMAFAGSIAFSLYVIADLNHPRAGLIRVDAADHAIEGTLPLNAAGHALNAGRRGFQFSHEHTPGAHAARCPRPVASSVAPTPQTPADSAVLIFLRI